MCAQNRLRAQDLHRFFFFVLIPSSENLVFIYCAPMSGEYARRFKKDLLFNFYRLRKSEPSFSSKACKMHAQMGGGRRF